MTAPAVRAGAEGPRLVSFEKWEGLGNDFVVLPEQPLTDEEVRALCDRRLGVGADGVLLVGGAAAPGPLSMVVRNADGSRPEMCGNGLRCVAGYLAARGLADDRVEVRTDAGPRSCTLTARGPTEARGAVEVRVDMGVAREVAELVVAVGDETLTFQGIDVGNPHAIHFEVDLARLAEVGPVVTVARPGGVNVELCRLVPGPTPPLVEVAVWERGVGPTRACGTGACAVAAAACARGLVAYGAPVTVRLPGGDLVIEVAESDHRVFMTGPARRVFTGTATLG